MSATATQRRTEARTTSPRNWMTPLNLHWAGVGLLVIVNLYLAAQMLFLWHQSSNYNAAAMAEQRAALQRAQVAAQPLRGLDEKISTATREADRFYKDRLPATDSAFLAELGALTKKDGVRFTGAQYVHGVVLPGSSGELTEVDIDTRLSGDYRPLVTFLNSLERDKMFFIIKGVTLTGQQSGTVNLRLRLTTYERGGMAEEAPNAALAAGGTEQAGGGR